MKIRISFLYAILLILSIGCSAPKEKEVSAAEQMNNLSETYVKLVLDMGQYIPDYIDAYYGPEEYKPNEADKLEQAPFGQYDQQINELISSLSGISTDGLSELEQLRHSFLQKQFVSVKTKIDQLGGKKYTFNEEAKLLYDADPPHYDSAYFQAALDQLNELLPGDGSISERIEAFRQDFIIPIDKLDTVFQTAIIEARKRTSKHIDMPENENFTVEYVTDKSWSGYNWYKGNAFSLIQVNTDLPIRIDRAIDLACHEGYPGHHVLNTMLEKNLVNGQGWVEFSVYPLFSPPSLIAEGSANYGIEVAFPGAERITYEKEVLFPLAGMDSSQCEKYYEVETLVGKLNYAGNEAARDYLDDKITKEQAIDWLVKYALMTPERAAQRVGFIEQYRSYVINYNLGKDIAREYVESNGGTADNPERRWEIFEDLISTPRTASGLQ